MEYSTYEVRPVVEKIDALSEVPGAVVCEAITVDEVDEWDLQDDGALRLFWTVYGRCPKGFAVALCDCADQDTAEFIAGKLGVFQTI